MTMETGAQPMLNDAELSRVIAREAGARLLELRESFGVIDPADRKRADLLRKEGDREAQKLLAAALAEHRPDDAILSDGYGWAGQSHLNLVHHYQLSFIFSISPRRT